jgi:hypothetical protein
MRDYARQAFRSFLPDDWAFDFFYESLDDRAKDVFLGVAGRYLFLVKEGDWHVQAKDSNSVIDYLTNSFKLVALFSLIESLSTEKHLDFYDWMGHQGSDIFPVRDKTALRELYGKYKLTYGAIRRCVAFFERLPKHRQEKLRASIQIDGAPPKTMKEVAQFLYNLRSRFVHEGELVLDIASIPVMSRHNGALTLTKLSIPNLLEAFEEGVIEYFVDAT